jgi:hypothetical protein
MMVHQQPLATALLKYVRRKRRNVQDVTVRTMCVHLFNTDDPSDVFFDRYLRIVHHNSEVFVSNRMVRITFLDALPTLYRCFACGVYDRNRSVLGPSRLNSLDVKLGKRLFDLRVLSSARAETAPNAIRSKGMRTRLNGFI